jgi:hypothetical protein
MKNYLLQSLAVGLAALSIASTVSAQTRTVRVASYNIQDDTGGIVSPTCGLIAPYEGPGGTFGTSCSGSVTNGGVLEGIGEEIVNGDPAQPIDVLALQETTSNPTTVQPIVNALNAFYANYGIPAGYAMSPYQATEEGGSPTSGNGPNAMVYNTNTLQLLASVGIATPTGGVPNGNGMFRQCVRYEFAPAGMAAGTNNEFYVYVSHYKASPGSTDDADRLGEARIIRNDEAANLPANSRVLYVGDYNPDDNSGEPGYQTICSNSAPNGIMQGQGIDPLNTNAAKNINWSSSTTNTQILFMLSEESYELRYRDDLQIMTANVYYDQPGGLQYVPGTYHSFGNNATTIWGTTVNNGNNTALKDLDPALTNLTGLSASVLLEDLTGASDHLPVVADYTIPLSVPNLSSISSLNFGVANLAANVTNVITVTNVGSGTLVLSNATISGVDASDFTLGGLPFPVAIASGQSTSFTVFFTPQAGGTRTATLQINDNDGNNNPFNIGLSGTGNGGPAILWSFTNLTLNATDNCSVAMIDVTGSNYIQVSDVLGIEALTITQTPVVDTSLSAGTTNQVIITVTDSAGNTANSTNSIFVADMTAPVILLPPVNQTNNAGTTASFTVTATACTPLSYQWYFETNLLTSQTNSTLNLEAVDPSNAGSYQVVVSSEGGTTNSLPVFLTVVAQIPMLAGEQMLPGGGGFQLTFSGPQGQTYQVLSSEDLNLPWSQWTIIGSGMFGSTNAIFTDANATNSAQFYLIECP